MLLYEYLLGGEHEFEPGRAGGGGDNLPHLSLLEHKLEAIREVNKEGDRRPIPLGKGSCRLK